LDFENTIILEKEGPGFGHGDKGFFGGAVIGDLTLGGFISQYEKFITPSKGKFT
jgi:hypothetical protein